MASNKQENEETKLSRGSIYRVMSKGSGPEPIVTTGTFKGYTAFGHDTALSILIDPEKVGEPGMMRFIPCTTVLAVDVLAFKQEEKEKDKDEAKVYFG
ncbi:MAG: hypothetical protein LUO85_04325 [Methanomassiliicoccales archaeon]|nr:hypothetical protein [Methanomassiliicoccales archaeon]